jgi:hypothetical protein
MGYSTDYKKVNADILVNWYSVTKDLQIKKIDSPETFVEKDIRYFIKEVESGRQYTTSFDNTFDLSDYYIYDKLFNSTELKIGAFKFGIGILRLPVYQDSYASILNGSRIKYVVRDYFNQIRNIEMNGWITIDILQSILFKYKEYQDANIRTWREVDLYEENKKLSAEILRLKKIELKNKPIAKDL